ncbi:hypothetical protein GGX14DRAFT_645661 [Mycena pura]|uniref:Uncharacterized protein n=1 Tax=Mycena pura TaxID=153505 RepID=A0AAD6V807_9AGAR|nr:hypothetical protein GGX14DRAFT_645661 [Mycena pura]
MSTVFSSKREHSGLRLSSAVRTAAGLPFAAPHSPHSPVYQQHSRARARLRTPAVRSHPALPVHPRTCAPALRGAILLQSVHARSVLPSPRQSAHPRPEEHALRIAIPAAVRAHTLDIVSPRHSAHERSALPSPQPHSPSAHAPLALPSTRHSAHVPSPPPLPSSLPRSRLCTRIRPALGVAMTTAIRAPDPPTRALADSRTRTGTRMGHERKGRTYAVYPHSAHPLSSAWRLLRCHHCMGCPFAPQHGWRQQLHRRALAQPAPSPHSPVPSPQSTLSPPHLCTRTRTRARRRLPQPQLCTRTRAQRHHRYSRLLSPSPRQ